MTTPKRTYHISTSTSFQVDGRSFASMEQAEQHVLECRVSDLINKNIENVSLHEHNDYIRRIIKNRDALVQILKESP